MTEQSPWLLTEEVAAHYRTTVGTVRYWRVIGYGPRGVKVGTRVLYAIAEVERFDRLLMTGAGYVD